MAKMAAIRHSLATELRTMADMIEELGTGDGVGFCVFVYDEFDPTEVKSCEIFYELESAVEYHMAASGLGESAELRCHIKDMKLNILNSEVEDGG